MWEQLEAELLFESGMVLPRIVPPVVPVWKTNTTSIHHHSHRSLSSKPRPQYLPLRLPLQCTKWYAFPLCLKKRDTKQLSTTPRGTTPIPTLPTTEPTDVTAAALLQRARHLTAEHTATHPQCTVPALLTGGRAGSTTTTTTTTDLHTVALIASFCGSEQERCTDISGVLSTADAAEARHRLHALRAHLGDSWEDTALPFATATAELVESAPECTAHTDPGLPLLATLEMVFMLDTASEELAHAAEAFQVRHAVMFLQVMAEVTAAVLTTSAASPQHRAGTLQATYYYMQLEPLENVAESILSALGVACEELHGVEVGVRVDVQEATGGSVFAAAGLQSCVILAVGCTEVATVDGFAAAIATASLEETPVRLTLRRKEEAMQ